MSRRRPTLAEPEDEHADAPGYWDGARGCRVTKVFPGEYRVARPGEGLATVLGSCVAACVRHPGSGRGGMNHFMLAGTPRPEEAASTRYGEAAMVRLIQAVLRDGGRPQDLEVKVFGGSTMGCAAKVGRDNAEFVLDWLAAAGIPVAARDLGGPEPRKLLYFPDDGRVLMQRLGGARGGR